MCDIHLCDAGVPGQTEIKSSSKGMDGHKYEVEWDIHNTGGLPILKYEFNYTKVFFFISSAVVLLLCCVSDTSATIPSGPNDLSAPSDPSTPSGPNDPNDLSAPSAPSDHNAHSDPSAPSAPSDRDRTVSTHIVYSTMCLTRQSTSLYVTGRSSDH